MAQLDIRLEISRVQFNRLVQVTQHKLPVLFLFLYLRHKEVSFCVVRVDLQDVFDVNPRFVIVAGCEMLLGACQVLLLTLLPPAAAGQAE